jgi:hypothetical protein
MSISTATHCPHARPFGWALFVTGIPGGSSTSNSCLDSTILLSAQRQFAESLEFIDG